MAVRTSRMAGAGAIVGALFFSLAGLAQVASGAEAARWVASDAAIYLEVSRPDVLMDRANDPALAKLLDAVPALGRYRNSEEFQKLLGVVDFLANQLDTGREEGLRKALGNGVALAVEGEPGAATRAFLIVAPSDPGLLRRAVATIIAAARKDAEDKGNPDPVREGRHRDVTGYAVGDRVAFAIVGNSLVIANSGDAIKRVIDRAVDGLKPGEALADAADWKTERAKFGPDTLAWAFVRLDRLRQLDPKRFAVADKITTPETLLFRPWIEALRSAPTISACLKWTDDGRIDADVNLLTPNGLPEFVKGFLPPQGAAAPDLALPPRTIASVSLWRDLSVLWDKRDELFAPEDVKGLAQLDSLAGTFFGKRDFGSGVLGTLANNFRLVVADQDHKALKPAPDVKLPACALVIDVKPTDDDDFAQRLKVTFQSFVGMANFAAAQSKSKTPPLELGSEECEGVTISTARYMVSKKKGDPNAPVHERHNFSPAIAIVDDHFVISSTVALARDLVKTLKAPAEPNKDKNKDKKDATLVMALDGKTLANLAELNRARLVAQNMLDRGNDNAKAEEEVDSMIALLNFLGKAGISVQDKGTESLLKLNLKLGAGK